MEYQNVIKLLGDLRSEGINVAVDVVPNKKIGAQIKTAEKKNIRYISVVGESELASRRFKLKNLQTGVEEELSIERLVAKLKDKRS